jgi:hypothetical protein
MTQLEFDRSLNLINQTLWIDLTGEYQSYWIPNNPFGNWVGLLEEVKAKGFVPDSGV